MQMNQLTTQLLNGAIGCWAPLQRALELVINNNSLLSKLKQAGLIELGSVSTMDAGLAWINWDNLERALTAATLPVTSADTETLWQAIGVYRQTQDAALTQRQPMCAPARVRYRISSPRRVTPHWDSEQA